MAQETRLPKYRKQSSKGEDRAFVELDGRRVYLGKYGSKVSRERYRRIIAERDAGGTFVEGSCSEITITELVAAFWDHAETYYRRPDGTKTNEITTLRYVLKPLIELYGSERVATFGPKRLKAVRERMIKMRWCRSSINKNMSRIRSVFRWGVENEIVAPNVLHGLQALRGLSRGRTEAVESEPVLPVPDGHINAVCPFVSSQVWALIQLQLHTGARAGELVGLRAVDIDTSGRVWAFRPEYHKTSHHEIKRVIFFGPTSQAILRPFMADRPIDAPLFSPREAEAERHAEAETHRRPDQQPNERKTNRKIGDVYTVGSYRRRIHRACVESETPQWSPHRLRHNAATRLRAEAGIDVAQTVLGHRIGSVITELYAEANVSKAIEIVRRIG